MNIERTSPITGKTRVKDLDITEEQIDNFNSGMMVQEAFPHLKAEDREFILTGISDDEWEEMFKEEENDGV